MGVYCQNYIKKPFAKLSKCQRTGSTDDMGTCCFAAWCGCCQIYNMAEDLGESGWLYVALTCITPCIPIFLLRGKAREQYDIQGDTTDDALMACCCGFCMQT